MTARSAVHSGSVTQPPQMTYYGPPPRKRMSQFTGQIIAGVVAFIVLGTMAVTITLQAMINTDRRDAQRPPAAAAVAVDQQDVARYWADNFAATSWYALTATPTWDGSALVARTTMHADADAREPAIAMCRAMVNYWGTRGMEFQPARVLDKADAILVSARTPSDSCAWRR